MPMDHQDGNQTSLYMSEEVTLGVLAANPVWYEREPNSYSDFGGNFAMTTRMMIVHDRQHPKGEISDNNPTAGFTEDLTPRNMRRPMQAFLFADAREKPATRPINGTVIAITSVDGAAHQYKAAAGLTIFKSGHLLFGAGFIAAANNGLQIVTAVAAGAVTVSGNVVNDAAPSAVSELQAVGFQFAAGGAVLSLPQGRAVITVAAGGILGLGLNLGEWLGVGGDTAVTQFATAAPFYGRLSAFTDTTMEFDKTTGVQQADVGAAKTIQIFFGTVVRNEDDCTLIKARSYTLERQYGCGAGAQSDYVDGWMANQITVTVPTPGNDAKVTVAITGIATRSGERSTTDGVLAGIAGSSLVAALNEPCFKPGLDVYQHKLAVIDDTTLNPTGVVAYNVEGTVVINNNLAGNKAIETFGNASINVGQFTVTGTLTAYWTNVDGTRTVRLGSDCTWHLILTKKNAAVIFDIASLGLGNGRATVEANQAVKLPLDTGAGKGKFGYTLLTTFLRYVPSVLLAQQVSL